jgi:microcystin-dependent protein
MGNEMDAAVAKLAEQISTTPDRPLAMRIASVTAVDSGAGGKVQTSETSTGWINRSEDTFLAVGDRVWLLNQGASWVVGGRLSGEASGNPVGGLMPYAGATAPPGWMICDGTAVSRTTYAGLFAICGTTYGAGNGTTTFNIPDFRGKVVLGVSGSFARGATGGAATVTLNTSQIPSHDHGGVGDHGHGGVGDHDHSFTTYQAAGRDTGGLNTVIPVSGGTITVSGAGAHSHGNAGGHSHSSVGSGGSHENLPPYQAIPYIIRAL